MPTKLLTEEDRTAIADAISRAEKGTSGEIAFAVADSSANYHHAILVGAMGGMAAATAVYLLLPTSHTIALVLWVELVSFALLYALLYRVPWRRWFIPAQEMDRRTREAAFLQFYASGLYRTKESNGVLIYLSLFERRVVVLGDRGIHEKLGDRHWDEVRDGIISGIKAGRAREGICAAVGSCGAALARYFPVRPDDVNEIPNAVIDRPVNPQAP